MENMFIKSITVNDNKITVSVLESYQHFLKEDMVKKMLRDAAVNALGEIFIQLEVSKSTFRITVTNGTEEKAKKIIEEEITKNIEMALSFLNAMNQ